MKARKVLISAVVCALGVVVAANSVFAADEINPCPKETGLKWYTKSDVEAGNFKAPQHKVNGKDVDYVKCGDITINDGKTDTTYRVYGETSKDCTKANAIGSAKKCAEDNDLKANIALIINTIIGIIGIVAVVVIILGGITYSTSQGDPAKVKKGKDTILYGVIGVVVSLLAFAIVNFVLDALING